jgi:di/tripeptidase
MQDLDFLKEVLSVPTKTYQEEMMVQYISDWLKNENIDHYVDEHMNVYAIKQSEKVEPDFYFPCVVSHTDTVHNIDTINIREEMKPNSKGELKLSLKAYNDSGRPTGIGGDDKCGVFACLKLLKELPYLKAAFFVAEETGCHGSKKADERFFSDVGYVIQFDAPEDWMVTENCYGAKLFDRDSDFFQKCDQILVEGMENRQKYMTHPYTDVYALKTKFDFACINFSIGYYNYHSPNEYVVVEDTFKGIELGRKLITNLGHKKYFKSIEKSPKFIYW